MTAIDPQHLRQGIVVNMLVSHIVGNPERQYVRTFRPSNKPRRAKMARAGL
jgi:hypothetical protein